MSTNMPLLFFAEPGSTRKNKTGSWRTFRPVCDLELCTACTLCEGFCPEGIITVTKEEKYHADMDYCKGCGLCAEVCPVGAITMEREVQE